MRVVAQIRFHQFQEAFARCARRRQHEKRQCDLGSNHRAVAAPSTHASGHAARTGLHQARDIRPREL